jgi:hypothetical protein
MYKKVGMWKHSWLDFQWRFLKKKNVSHGHVVYGFKNKGLSKVFLQMIVLDYLDGTYRKQIFFPEKHIANKVVVPIQIRNVLSCQLADKNSVQVRLIKDYYGNFYFMSTYSDNGNIDCKEMGRIGNKKADNTFEEFQKELKKAAG